LPPSGARGTRILRQKVQMRGHFRRCAGTVD